MRHCPSLGSCSAYWRAKLLRKGLPFSKGWTQAPAAEGSRNLPLWPWTVRPIHSVVDFVSFTWMMFGHSMCLHQGVGRVDLSVWRAHGRAEGAGRAVAAWAAQLWGVFLSHTSTHLFIWLLWGWRIPHSATGINTIFSFDVSLRSIGISLLCLTFASGVNLSSSWSKESVEQSLY